MDRALGADHINNLKFRNVTSRDAQIIFVAMRTVSSFGLPLASCAADGKMDGKCCTP